MLLIKGNQTCLLLLIIWSLTLVKMLSVVYACCRDNAARC